MADPTVAIPRDASQVARLLGTPEIGAFIARLEDTRWTGRPGYPIRTMVGMALVKSLHALPTWTRVVALVTDHAALRVALGIGSGQVPSQWSCYRFTTKLREFGDALTECIDAVLAGLAAENPAMGEAIAIDGSDIPAYANGQRKTWRKGQQKPSDPDAAWGHRSAVSTRNSGYYFGYKVHAAVDVATQLPIAWKVRSANDAESLEVPGLLTETQRRGFAATFAIMDKGYDHGAVYDACHDRGIRPIIPLRATQKVKEGAHTPNKCGHGTWVFAGADMKRGAAKWRCPTGQCLPTASMWVPASRLHTLVPRTTDRWTKLYRQRGAVEREFGRLKHEWAVNVLRVRTLPRVQLHVDLTILARLATALDKARSVHEAPSTVAA